MTERVSQQILVVGAGPAGIAAAVAARASGASVGLVDDNPDLGGQIWRGEHAARGSSEAAKWIDRVESSGVNLLPGTQVVGSRDPKTLLAERDGRVVELHYQRLILATGARERFIPFPGWTLPNVMGAGGLQSLVKSGLPIKGKRVVVAGSGPLLLAVGASLKSKGAIVSLIAEQARFEAVARFGLGLWKAPHKLVQALGLKRNLSKVRVAFGTWPVRAEGHDRLASVVLSNGKSERSIACDYLACGFGLVPNIELAVLLGCETKGGKVVVDDWQSTNVSGIYSAGETLGIGGLEPALIEGQIAGYSAAGKTDPARALIPARARVRRFAEALEHAFALRDELRSVTTEETIVCRCEDVRLSQIQGHDNILAAKLQTRCGMGPCQGRICGPALEFLLGWKRGSIRPPVLPAELATLAGRSPLDDPPA